MAPREDTERPDDDRNEMLGLLQGMIGWVSVPSIKYGRFEREIAEPVRALLRKYGRLRDTEEKPKP